MLTHVKYSTDVECEVSCFLLEVAVTQVLTNVFLNFVRKRKISLLREQKLHYKDCIYEQMG